VTDLLHRLIWRARGAPAAASLRIEPLLSPRYAGTAEGIARVDGIDARVAARSDTAPAAPAAPSQPALAAGADGARATPAGPVAGAADAARAASGGPAPHAPQPPATPVGRGQQWIGHAAPPLPPAAADPPSLVAAAPTPNGGRIGDPEASPSARASSAEPAPAVQALRVETAVQARPSTAALASRDALNETTQTFSFSIGHVEVRNAPPPAAAPRRPAFRPSVSLDAFLERRGSNRR
jgi:hypothetical protein